MRHVLYLILWFGGGMVVGQVLFVAICKWRKASERRIWTEEYLDYPEWTWPFIAAEFVVTHPIRAWRAKWDK